MKYKIGVFGSSEAKDIAKLQEQAEKIGLELGKHKCVVITGAGLGLPYAASAAAYKSGAEIWGYSPVLDQASQKKFTPDQDLGIYTKLNFIQKNFEFSNDDLVNKKYRNVLSTATCDAGIIISGRWGTLNEFTNLVDMGKVVGVLTGTGGVADELPSLCSKIFKDGSGKVIFSDSPKELVEKVIRELELR